MAYDFDGTTYLERTGTMPSVSAVPVTISCWVRGDTAASLWIVSWGSTSGGDSNNTIRLVSTASGADIAYAIGAGGGSTAAMSPDDPINTNWHLVVGGVKADGTIWIDYDNASSTGTNTGGSFPTNWARVTYGAQLINHGQKFNGGLAEVAMWSVELSAADIAKLYVGAAPSRVRADALVSYTPLIRDLNDRVISAALTDSGSTAVLAHPRIVSPTRYFYAPAAAAGGGGGLTAMTTAHRTSGVAPLAVHFSAIDYTVRARDTSNVTGVEVGRCRNLTATGTATLHYRDNLGTDELAYTAPGDSQGSWVPFTADSQAYKLYSNNGTDWLYIDVTVASLPVGDTSDTLTLSTYRDTGGVPQPSNVFDTGDADYGSQSYYWWFKDTNPILYGKTNGRNSNTCYGAPVSAHLYTTPGTYTAKLSVWEADGTRNDYQQEITVTDQEATATVYYVDATLGSDSNDGLAPTDEGGGVGPLQTVGAALGKIVANDIVIKFKRGETWTYGSGTSIANNSITLTAYYNSDGTDDAAQARPKITYTADVSAFTLSAGVSEFRACHLELVGQAGTTGAAFSTAGTTPTDEVLIYNCKVSVFQAVGMTGGPNRWGHEHHFIVDCHFHNNGGNTIFFGVGRSAILGTLAEDPDGAGAEHVFRIWEPDEAVLADCICRNPQPAKHCLKYYSGEWAWAHTTSGAVMYGTSPYSAILRSDFTADASRWNVAIGASADSTDNRIEHVIMDGCYIENIYSPSNLFNLNDQNHTVRNCVLKTSNIGYQSIRRGVEPKPRHHHWYNNVLHLTRDDGVAINVWRAVGADASTADDCESIAWQNNITYASGTSPARAWNNSFCALSDITSDYNFRDSPGAGEYSRNAEDGGSATSRSLADTITGLSKDANSSEGTSAFTNAAGGDYTLQVGSDAIDAGDDSILAWVRLDANGAMRTAGIDCGAYEVDAVAPTEPMATAVVNVVRGRARMGMGFGM